MTDKQPPLGSCPVPDAGDGPTITLAHGEGGRLMRRLLREQILPAVGSAYLADLGDAAVLPPASGQLAFSTDGFVVSPIFFPGGDIGSLAVYGTANDLAVAGAVPKWISLGLIIEEGVPVTVLQRVLASAAHAAERAGVQVVTGDTKVVPRGAADQLFLNTSGVGEFVCAPPPGPAALQAGDALIVTGPIGRHGMAVMTSREGLQFDPAPISDSGPLVASVMALQRAEVSVRAMRDATRGGVAAVLHEWSDACDATMELDESQIPVSSEVRGVCEVLGLDPLHVANEGTMVVAVAPGDVETALSALRGVAESAGAAPIGQVVESTVAPVVVRRSLGRPMPLDEPLGAPLPRIC